LTWRRIALNPSKIEHQRVVRRLGDRAVQPTVPELPGLGVMRRLALLQQALHLGDLRFGRAQGRHPRQQRLDHQPRLQHLVGAGPRGDHR
jgi:hypothetical protein